MSSNEKLNAIKKHPEPVVVDLWAPWCFPCRQMEQPLKNAADQFAGRVGLLKINADEDPDIVRSLNVWGIPTIIAFSQGQEVQRLTGVQSSAAIEGLFQAALDGIPSHRSGLTSLERLLRAGSGLGLLAIGWLNGYNPVLLLAGGVLLFSAFYDRCPVYQAIAPRLRALFTMQGFHKNE